LLKLHLKANLQDYKLYLWPFRDSIVYSVKF